MKIHSLGNIVNFIRGQLSVKKTRREIAVKLEEHGVNPAEEKRPKYAFFKSSVNYSYLVEW